MIVSEGLGGAAERGLPGGSSDAVSAILDRITDAFFAVDRSWRITAVNAAARRVFEALSPAAPEALGRTLWDVFPGLLGTRFEDEYRRALLEGRAAHFEGHSAAADVWFEVHAYPSGEGLSVYFRDVSERKRVEEALRASESMFRQLAETIREVLWVMSPDLKRLDYVNPAYEEIFGRSRESLYADPSSFVEAILPEDREAVVGRFRGLGDDDVVAEYRISRPTGEVRWIWVRAVPVHGADGELLRVVGICEDITGRKETEGQTAFLAEAGRALASSLDYEETLRGVARLAVPRIADWCAIYVVEDGSVRTLEVAHVDPAKVALARELAERYPDDPNAQTGVHHVIRTGQPEFYGHIPEELIEAAAQNAEHLRILRELQLRSAMTVPMVARGRTIGAISFIGAESGRRFTRYDLAFAEQLAARAALAVDNARLYAEAHRRMVDERALREAAEAVSASFTVEAVIDQISRSAMEATGAVAALVEQVDQDGREVHVVASYGEAGLAQGARLPYTGSFAEYVLVHREPVLIERISAAHLPLPPALRQSRPDDAALVMPLADGDVAIGALFLLREASRGAFRPDDRARALTFANLAALAFRKVHLLRDSEQRRAQLEEVMESRARLVRGFTHDLRNPLGAADGFLELVESGIHGELGEQQRASISRARRLMRTALGLIGDVLELARVEAGLLEMQPRPVDVRETAREVAEEFRAQAEAKGLELLVEAQADVPVVRTDAERVRQILGNLVSNAIKFTGTGRVTISVDLDEASADPVGDRLAIRVADTGPGIPKHEQALLFREFSRVGHGSESGMGLGLAISRSLAEALGGTVTVQSEEGRGSTFTLWLPLERQTAPS